MSNLFAVNDLVLKKALAVLLNNLSMAHTANRDYEQAYNVTTGQTVRVRKPIYYTVRSGAAPQVQDITENVVNVTIDHQKGVDLSITSVQKTLFLDSFSDRVIGPAMVQLANQVDQSLIQKGLDKIYNTIGSAGSGVSSFSPIGQASGALTKFGVQGERYISMNINDATSVKNSLQNSFNTMLNKEISKDFAIGRLSGFDFFENQNMLSHTNGVATGTPLINGANQTGSTLVTDGWTPSTTGILKKGDIIYISTGTPVYAVNPVSRQATGATTGDLQRFIVTADVNSDGSGNVSIPISPSITTTGAYQNVTSSPSDNAAITVVGGSGGNYSNNFFYSRDAFTLACVPLHQMEGAKYCKVLTDKDTNISLRLIQNYDNGTDADLVRFDILYGVECFPEYAGRLIA